MVAHSHDLGNDRLAGPFHAKHLRQLLEIVGSGLTDREDSVAKPAHAQVAQLLVEELNTKLAGKKRDVLDDGKSYTPLLVLG